VGRPFALTVDSEGNVYIAQLKGYLVRKVDKDGIITTVAGNGETGYREDGVAATSTSLHAPRGLETDEAGDLYIADLNSKRVRRVVFNQPPVAVITAPSPIIEEESVTFDGTTSYDPDGTITSCSWDFGDESPVAGCTVSYCWDTAGTYSVTLTVTDDNDATATDTITVTVQTASAAIDDLRDKVRNYNFQQGISNALDKKLENANEALDSANAEQRQDAINKLNAFINATEAQRGKELTEDQADDLISDARRIIAPLDDPDC